MAYLGLETIRQGNSAACIQDVFTLHFPTATKVIDTTYGAGRFWGWPHNLKVVGMDIDPPGPVDVVGDYRNLPFKPGSCDVLVFDPPYIFSNGIQRVIGTKRFFRGVEDVEVGQRTHSKIALKKPKNPQDLLLHYYTIFEQRDVATQGLIVKGQDLITGKNRDYWMYNVITLARECGMGFPTDYILQHSPAARMKDPRWQVQKKFRTVHCIYLVWKWS